MVPETGMSRSRRTRRWPGVPAGLTGVPLTASAAVAGRTAKRLVGPA
jgi:hypothetical protein